MRTSHRSCSRSRGFNDNGFASDAASARKATPGIFDVFWAADPLTHAVGSCQRNARSDEVSCHGGHAGRGGARRMDVGWDVWHHPARHGLSRHHGARPRHLACKETQRGDMEVIGKEKHWEEQQFSEQRAKSCAPEPTPATLPAPNIFSSPPRQNVPIRKNHKIQKTHNTEIPTV